MLITAAILGVLAIALIVFFGERQPDPDQDPPEWPYDDWDRR